MSALEAAPETEVRCPAARPCGSCPYRKDVPSGVWDESEYKKLPEYDRETPAQPPNLFLCHQADGRVCAGWAAVHDMEESFALRLAGFRLPLGVIEAIRSYVTDVPLFASGAEACAHGLKEVESPGESAARVIMRLRAKRSRRSEG